jgi:hypothetical protein
MRWRPGHLLFIAFQAIWLNIVIPGHTRGSMPMPGADCEDSTCQVSHSFAASPCCDHSKTPATPAKNRGCAICNFAAQLATPLPFDLSLPPLALLHRIGDLRAHALVARSVLIPFFSCGPPACA